MRSCISMVGFEVEISVPRDCLLVTEIYHSRPVVGLRVKLSLGLKLCKLQGRFLARVNTVNYTVNYKISAQARDSKNHVPIFQRPKYGDAEGAKLSTLTRSTQKHRQNSFYLPRHLMPSRGPRTPSHMEWGRLQGFHPWIVTKYKLESTLSSWSTGRCHGAWRRRARFTRTLWFKIVKNRPRISKLYYRSSRIPPWHCPDMQEFFTFFTCLISGLVKN